ncbi:NAD(P)/FAD-dependent oxidoreductase [Cupriavidus lacunae]|uniref:Pyridine nucleotide-disulfide oxidoreductase n=1 Tax=Cupriavidus lacunae TaxID=2666307 RepID=A0A370NJT4_9BURK|nr:FAD-dependent oxidoreductase [Cupriavidus lacunae]RDK05861.1 pyridine nucleotide-disulfide oxidoreductase [Cupriavidus lacunae]
MNASDSLIIVGAGTAAAELAVHTRMGGWSGRIIMIGDEAVLPYHRPPLSKAWLAGEADLSALLTRPASVYEKAGIECWPGLAVTALDRAAKTIALSDGRSVPYGRLALCTGGRPRPWAAHGLPADHHPGNLHVLRTLADAERLHGALQEGGRLLIVGAGYIGLEVAAAARKRGVAVTVVELASRVLARSACDAVSSFYERLHAGRGVNVRTGSAVAQVQRASAAPDAPVTALELADGTRLPCDAILVGIGMLPNSELAEAAGLRVDRGIVVDNLSRTSDPDIVAAGDCTAQDLGCGTLRRLESVPNAVEQARAAASWLCGKPKPNLSVPWFWSDQYDVKLQMAGTSEGSDAIVRRGEIAASSFTLFHLREGVVIGATVVNRPGEFLQVKRLVGAQAIIERDLLEDDNLPLKDIVLPRVENQAAQQVTP